MTSLYVTAHKVPVQHTVAFHTPIYEAIYARDAEAARKQMMAHLIETRNQMLARELRGKPGKFERL